MTQQGKKCIFCLTSPKRRRSKERIFARWLPKELNNEDTEIAATRLSSTGEPVSERVHSLIQRVAVSICHACHAGWMSNLEGEIIPALKLLLCNRLLLSALSLDLRASLASWTARKAHCLNYVSIFPFEIPSAHLHAHASGKQRPEGVLVTGQHHLASEPFCGLLGGFLAGVGQQDASAQGVQPLHLLPPIKRFLSRLPGPHREAPGDY